MISLALASQPRLLAAGDAKGRVVVLDLAKVMPRKTVQTLPPAPLRLLALASGSNSRPSKTSWMVWTLEYSELSAAVVHDLGAGPNAAPAPDVCCHTGGLCCQH